jgi:hypothetical protein
VFDHLRSDESARDGDTVAELCSWHDAFPVGSFASPLVHHTLGNATASTVDMEWSGDADWANQAVHGTAGRQGECLRLVWLAGEGSRGSVQEALDRSCPRVYGAHALAALGRS